MKVLQILPLLELGGVERGVIDLARSMKNRGEEMVVISSGGPLVGELQKIGVPHYELPVQKKSFFSLTVVSRIAAIIEKERIDVVHARSRVPAWLGWLAARKTHRPFVTTCHGYYSDHSLSHVMGWGKRVIVISHAIGRHMIDDFKVSPERIRLIHRGVDFSQFVYSAKIKRAEAGARPYRMINIGRLSPIKGQVEFIKAVYEARKQIPNLEVWIVGSEGEGKTKYTEKIRQTIQQLRLESCIQMLGTRRDIPDLLKQADLLVLGTLVPEAFGRVIVEAGAIGTPVIATALGGVLDIIDSGENGFLVPPGDITAMAEAMVKILTDYDLAQKFSVRLRDKVQECFTLEKMTDATLNVYREVLREKKILVIKLGALGDVILAIPSLRMLRERFPEAWILVLVDRKIAPILSSVPYMNEVIPVDRSKLGTIPYLLKTAKRIRQHGFDISLDFQNSKWTHLLAYLGGVRERYGFGRGWLRNLLNRPDSNARTQESPVRNQFRILSKLGVRELDEVLELPIEPDAQKKVETLLAAAASDSKRVGFVMGSSLQWPTKRWPIEKFVELARRLIREQKCRIVLIGSPEEGISAEAFDNESGVTNLIGKTSLTELAALVKKMQVVVTGDTAPLHLAAAGQVPVVAFFGPTDPKRHMPPAKQAVTLVKNLKCQPCYSGTCRNPETLACLKEISVSEVFNAVTRLLKSKEEPFVIPAPATNHRTGPSFGGKAGISTTNSSADPTRRRIDGGQNQMTSK